MPNAKERGGAKKKERILLWQDPVEDQEAAALAAEASVEAVALAEADLAAVASAVAAVTVALADIITDITTDISTDTIITITARDFSFLDRGVITTAEDIMAGAAVLARSSVYS